MAHKKHCGNSRQAFRDRGVWPTLSDPESTITGMRSQSPRPVPPKTEGQGGAPSYFIFRGAPFLCLRFVQTQGGGVDFLSIFPFPGN
jgi:hypothetical protein